MPPDRDELREELRQLLRAAHPVNDASKRAAIRETARVTHSELLLRYWLKESYGTTDFQDIEGFALDRTMCYIHTVAHMLDSIRDEDDDKAVEIDILKTLHKAVVILESPYDPENQKLRADG